MADDRTFELYKMLVDEVRDTRRARRELVNIFTSINLAGVGALGFLAIEGGAQRALLVIWTLVALTMICIVWRMSNAYYRRLLEAKYAIIYEYEEKLGEHPIKTEYLAMTKPKVGKAPNYRLFKFFSLERAMPLFFIGGYVAFALMQLSLDDIAGAIHYPAAWWARAQAIQWF